MPAGPVIRFYRAIPAARSPEPADKSAKGALPTKAFQFCEPARAASGWGWYLYPPCDLSLTWKGRTEYRWALDGQPIGTLDGAGPMHAGPAVDCAQYPGVLAQFNAVAPPACQDYVWPLIGALQEPGRVQIWTGWLAQTPPDWSLSQRPIVNRPPASGYYLNEGIIETDWWFGPIFVNVQLTRTHQPVHIRRAVPLAQLQPVPRVAYQTKFTTAEVSLEAWTADDWARYQATVVDPHPRGAYAVASRQRPACPVYALDSGGA